MKDMMGDTRPVSLLLARRLAGRLKPALDGFLRRDVPRGQRKANPLSTYKVVIMGMAAFVAAMVEEDGADAALRKKTLDFWRRELRDALLVAQAEYVRPGRAKR